MSVGSIVAHILVSVVFVSVSYQFLFPENYAIPLDRRMSGLLGAALVAVIAEVFSGYYESIPIDNIDIEVLVILVCIMVINFVMTQQSRVSTILKSMQNSIQEDDNYSFWLVSFIAFIVSPFVTNDGLCLLLVFPVLDAMQTVVGAELVIEQNRLFYMMSIASSANIGSVMTFTGNPQNILIAKSLSDLMSGGTFLGLMLLPSTVCWVITTGYLNVQRINSINMCYIEGNISNEYSHENSINQSRESSRITSGNQSVISVAESSSNSKSERSTLDVPLITDSRPTTPSRMSFAVTRPSRVTTTTQIPHGHSMHDRPTMSNIQGMQRLVTKSAVSLSNVGPVSFAAFGLFAILVAAQLSGLVPLVLLFAVIAVLMTTSVVLVNYYTGHPRKDNNGKDLTNEERRHHISKYVDKLFLEIDYNLIIIFVGMNFFV